MPNLIGLWVAEAQYCLRADSKDLHGHTCHLDGVTTVNLVIFARILFSLIGLKHIFVTLKNPDKGVIHLYQ